MPFDETPQYSGAIAAGDIGTPNMWNSFYVQRDTFANRPVAGNAGVVFISTNGIGGTGAYEAIYRDNGATWDLLGVIPPDDSTARISTGTYTGDGTTSQAITGLGFQPKFLLITERITSGRFSIKRAIFTTTVIVDDDAAGGAISMDNAVFSQDWGAFVTNAIISLDADGFTVDDNGADEDPNQTGVTYNYLAIG